MLSTLTRVAPALALIVLAASPVRAQTPAAPASAAEAAQKAAFLALPEASRKAAQDALIWLGFYNGVADGDFGKRTRDAIQAWQGSVKAPADGALTPSQLAALTAAAGKARESVGFKPMTDAKSGARIGAPTRLLFGRVPARLDLTSSADPDLGALYAKVSAPGPSRKIAYKVMKPDAFFVVSGQDGASTFYTRFEKNSASSPPIRGFTFSYPAARAAEFDRVALAVANSFEAFPSAAPPAPVAASPAPPAPAPVPAATALVVAPGEALTALKAEDCANATVGGKPVRFERADAATALALIAGDFGPRGEAPRFGAAGADLVALGFAGSRLSASPASLSGDAARPLVVASLESSAAGAPVFDRAGALAGMVGPIGEDPRRIGGIALAAPHGMIAADAVRAFLGAGEPASAGGPALSAGDIAARNTGAVVAVFCQK